MQAIYTKGETTLHKEMSMVQKTYLTLCKEEEHYAHFESVTNEDLHLLYQKSTSTKEVTRNDIPNMKNTFTNLYK